jgi:hypothetical protein
MRRRWTTLGGIQIAKMPPGNHPDATWVQSGRRLRKGGPMMGALDRCAAGRARGDPQLVEFEGHRSTMPHHGILGHAYQDESTNYDVSLLARVLGVSRAGHDAWKKSAPSRRTLADQQLTGVICEI